MSEAEHITDWGDYAFEEFEKQNLIDIIEAKADRLQKLKNKWVLTSKSKSGKATYFQDRLCIWF